MNKKSKKTTKLTKADLAPENFKTQAENEAALEEYRIQNNYNYFQFFFGNPNNIDTNKQQGKPGAPPYP